MTTGDLLSTTATIPSGVTEAVDGASHCLGLPAGLAEDQKNFSSEDPMLPPFAPSLRQVHKPVVSFGAYRFNLPKMVLQIEGQRLKLSPVSFRLALILFTNLGRTLSYGELSRQMWGAQGDDLPSAALYTRVAMLRESLGLRDGHHGYELRTMYRQGYCLIAV